jgi:small subunit ribosomal protein S20
VQTAADINKTGEAGQDMQIRPTMPFGKYGMERGKMANIKSAKKRVITNAKKGEANKGVKTGVKTVVKKVNAAVEGKDQEASKAAMKDAEATIRKAASKGVIKKNTASRKVSRLSKKVAKVGKEEKA